MIDIIKVELYRLKKSTLFWVMLGVSAATPIITVLLNIALVGFMGMLDQSTNVLEFLRDAGITSGLLQQMSTSLNDLSLWPLIATAVILSKEFTDGTMRNVIMANKSRTELYFGYLITALIVAICYFVSFLAVTLIVIAPIFGFQGVDAGKVVSAIFCSLGLGIIAAAFIETCVCMFLFGVRKQWATILFPILIWYAPIMFSTFLSGILSGLVETGQIASIDFLRWIPFCNMQYYYKPFTPDGVVVGMHILYMAAFIAAFTCIGYFTFKKADLK